MAMMKTLIKDEELGVELQELYLTGKQWLSDLEFLENEERFLSEQAAGLIIGGNILARLANAALNRTLLKAEIAGFMNKFEPLTVDTSGGISLQLVEDFVLLQTAVQDALAVLKGIKYALIAGKHAA